MTEFRKHDRLRVIDDGRRSLTRGPFPYKKGEIVTVESMVSRRQLVNLTGDANPMGWVADRFELVERAVGHDKDGKPLYVGDTITVTATGTRETKVLGHPVPDGQIPVVVRKGSDVIAGVGGHAHFSNVALIRHHWEPEPKPFGPVVEGHELAVGAFMVLKRGSAIAWGKVEGWSVSGGTQVQVTLSSYGGATTYALNDSRDADPWRVILHQPAAPKPDHWAPIHWGFDGIEVVELKMPKLDPEAIEKQIRSYARMFEAVNLCPPNAWGDRASNHGAGQAVDVPVQLNWDDVVIGSVVQVRVRATGEEFTAEVTESPNGTKKGNEPSPHVHGIWTGTSIVRKHWELLRNDLPVPPLPTEHTSIVAPKNETDKSRAILLNGQWYFTTSLPRVSEYSKTDPNNWAGGWRLIRDAGKDN